MIEIDIHETSDGELVCIHDSTLDRTTSGRGDVHSFTYGEIKKLDAGAGQSIPTLEETLRFASGKMKVNIELKIIGAEEEVLEIVQRTGMLPNVIISSFFHATLTVLKESNEQVSTAMLLNTSKEELFQYALDFRVDAINPQHNLVTPEFIEGAHQTGLLVYPWTVNEQHRMIDLFSMGVDGLITDYPDRAVRVLEH
jgi:glycerophosphoryl diester phosphodiesterase